MCVILAGGRKHLPSLEILEKCAQSNRDGAGLAWVAGEKVNYRKGQAPDQIHRILHEQKPRFWGAHFRLATVGGAQDGLTHPFPITPGAELDLNGTADAVLFHNGHWSDWRAKALDFAMSRNIDVPDGDWSDSRAAAWMAARAGTGVLSFIGATQKFLVLHKSGFNIWPLDGAGWEKDDHIYYSNVGWKHTHKHAGHRGGVAGGHPPQNGYGALSPYGEAWEDDGVGSLLADEGPRRSFSVKCTVTSSSMSEFQGFQG